MMVSSSCLFAAATTDLLLLLLLSCLAIFDVPVLDLLTSSWVLKIFNDLCGLVSISIHSRFFGYGLLTSILNNSLLAYGFTHTSATSHAEAARLEGREATTTTLTAHLHASETTPKEVVIVEAHAHEWITHTKWISVLATNVRLLICSHSIKAHAHLAETSSKKVIIIIEKVGKWISATEELSENFVS